VTQAHPALRRVGHDQGSIRRDPAQRLAHRLLDERCRYQARQTLFEPCMILALITVLGSTLSDSPVRGTFTAWAALLAIVSLSRSMVALNLLRKRFCRDARPYAALLRVSTGLTGLLLGAAGSLLFPHVDHHERMLITLALAGWLAAAIALHAAFPRHARLHLLLVLGQLALAWWLHDPEQGTYWAVGLITGAALLERLSQRLSLTLAIAQRGRHERRELLRRLAVESRQARSASAAASRFLAAASHDLRQPATALSLMSSLLSERCGDVGLKPLVDGIARSSVALNDLLGNLLDLSRLEAGVIQPDIGCHDVDSIIDDLRLEFEQRARSKGLTLHVQSCGGVVSTDRVLLMRMLRNLLENALRYTDIGNIRLSTGHGAKLEFSVADTGIGIPDALGRRLLGGCAVSENPGARSRRNGLGIGLAMVSRISRLLDAEIALESDGQRGSCFTIRMPLACWESGARPVGQPPGQYLTPGAQQHPGGAPARRALLVEDAPEVALAVAAMLESRGWCVDCAANEAEALSLLRGSARFGLIVSDFRLGGPIDGIELLQRARLLQPGSRCILTTADTGTSPRARAECAGFEFLPKPLRPESFS
jgi:signal transduction histidine kinase